MLKDINTLKNLHKTETNDLLYRIQILKETKDKNPIYKFQSLKIKNDLKNAENQIKLLSNENSKLKREKESLIKEKNDLKAKNIVRN